MKRILTLLVMSVIGGGGLPTVACAELELDVSPREIPLGGLAKIEVSGSDVRGLVGADELTFATNGSRSVAFYGVDLDATLGPKTIQVSSPAGSAAVQIEVTDKKYPEERLRVAKKFTQLSAKNLARHQRERARLDALWLTSTDEMLWRGPFRKPARGRAGSPFGKRRFFNDEPRSPHSGIDFKGAKGSPVIATNRGRVVMVSDLFFSGNTVVVDHGGGLFSLYLHLSATAVREGDLVESGGAIGKIGATGRVTGPHLHFATRIGAARVDPALIIGKEF